MNRQTFTISRWIARATLPLVLTAALHSQQSSAPPPTVHTVTTTGGTTNAIAKYSGTSSIVNSAIFEQGGKVGIGTASPLSTLTINGTLSSAGVIQSTVGGFKFPDGTTQATAAQGGLTSVSHFNTLAGNGTLGSPLGIALPLRLLGNTPGDLVSIENDSGYGLTASSIGATAGGLYGYSTGGFTVNGQGVGVYGESLQGPGIFGHSIHWVGVLGYTDTDSTWATEGYIVAGTKNATAIYGRNDSGSGNGWAGFFGGDVAVTGNLSKSGGSFKIDHPLDPANKYLYHSFVESPDMKNIYDGTVTTDRSGLATVTLPDYFSALNRDFRYQLTVIGQFAQAIVASKISDNRFAIRTDKPNVEVSWQVTGIRQDAWANAHRITVEEEKPAEEMGSFLHPELFNEAPEKSVEWARWPKQMQSISQRAQPKAK